MEMVTFPTNISAKVKNFKYLVCTQLEKIMSMLLIVLQNMITTFSNFHEGFSLIQIKQIFHMLHHT